MHIIKFKYEKVFIEKIKKNYSYNIKFLTKTKII